LHWNRNQHCGIFTALDFTGKPGSGLDDIQEKYVYLGTFELKDGMLVFYAK